MTRNSRMPGLMAAMLDLSFTEFLTPRLVRMLYAVTLAGAGVLVLGLSIAGFSRSFGSAIGGLLLGSLAALFLVGVTRILLEGAMVYFRIAENTAEIAEHAAEMAVNTAKSAVPAGDHTGTPDR